MSKYVVSAMLWASSLAEIRKLKSQIAKLQAELDALRELADHTKAIIDERDELDKELAEAHKRLQWLTRMGARVEWFMSGGHKRWQVSVDGQLCPDCDSPNKAIDAAMGVKGGSGE